MTHLEKVADILSSENQWTQGAFARSSQRKAPNDVFDSRAEQFSLAGAINKAYGRARIRTLPSLIKSQVRDYLKEHYGHNFTIDEWNDHPDRTFTEVQTLIKELDL